jgi:ElaB/YqjD/DUF883 family membrane-anchored ribosome-binding protein
MISIARNQSAARSSDGPGGALGDSAGELAAQAREYLSEAAEVVKDVITNRPALALGAALATGVLLGWLIKRR